MAVEVVHCGADERACDECGEDAAVRVVAGEREISLCTDCGSLLAGTIALQLDESAEDGTP